MSIVKTLFTSTSSSQPKSRKSSHSSRHPYREPQAAKPPQTRENLTAMANIAYVRSKMGKDVHTLSDKSGSIIVMVCRSSLVPRDMQPTE